MLDVENKRGINSHVGFPGSCVVQKILVVILCSREQRVKLVGSGGGSCALTDTARLFFQMQLPMQSESKVLNLILSFHCYHVQIDLHYAQRRCHK